METTYTYSALDEAQSEILATDAYYESEQMGLGSDFLSVVTQVQQDIVRHPFIGAVYKGSIRYRVLNHYWHHFPYTLFYDIYNQHITLLACWPQRRNPKILKRRLNAFRRTRRAHH